MAEPTNAADAAIRRVELLDAFIESIRADEREKIAQLTEPQLDELIAATRADERAQVRAEYAPAVASEKRLRDACQYSEELLRGVEYLQCDRGYDDEGMAALFEEAHELVVAALATLPTDALAELLAAEWAAEREQFQAFCKVVIDGVADARQALPMLGLKLQGTDLYCLAERIEKNLNLIRDAVPRDLDYVASNLRALPAEPTRAEEANLNGR